MSEEKRNFKVLNEREHVLTRPGMYIGSISEVEKDQWVFNKDTKKFEFRTVKFIPALLKCVDEIIDNSLDVGIDSEFDKISTIKVKVEDTYFEVSDDGCGIPVKSPSTEDPQGRTCVELAWTQMRAGTSFKETRKGPSANGVGSTCVNIFSSKFIGTSDDGSFCQTINCSDNMSVIKASKIKKSSGKSGVKVYVEPDLARFSIDKISDIHKDLIHQRLINLAISYPQIKFYFNNIKINVNANKFAEMFSENSVIASCDNATVCVFPNIYDEFKFYSYVNGLCCIRGGSQIDYITSEITSRVRDKLIKKYKTIRPGDVKTKLCVAVFLTDFSNAQFDAQNKESLTNPISDISKHIKGGINFDDFAKKILQNSAIIDPIIETFKIKEELKTRSEIRASKKERVKSDKYLSPIGEKKYLFLCEGQSAESSLCSCLGRDGNGFYCLRGLPINVLENSLQKIVSNQEFKDVMNLLGLDISKSPADNVTINFDKVVIATDQDLDGNHLSAMLIGWFRRFAPKLFNSGKICKLQTPLIIIKDAKDVIKHYFFNLNDFKKWEETNKNSKLKIFYQKGLGSIERSDMNELMNANGGFEYFLYNLIEDKTAFDNVDMWLSGDADKRREKIKNYTFNIDKV